VYFEGQDSLAGQIESGKANRTTLTGYFELNANGAVGADGVTARSIFYEDIPAYFSWNKGEKCWIPRKKKALTVGRVFSISYLAGERFYLRVLLLHRKGVVSFEDLRRVNGEVFPTYQDACNDLGLLVNDYLYDQALHEAATVSTGYQLAQMFAMICVHSPPSAPLELFTTHYLSFTDDCCRVDMRKRYSRQLRDDERRVLAIFRLKELVEGMGATLDSCGLIVTKNQRKLIRAIQAEQEGIED
jgi:hypothetical protein